MSNNRTGKELSAEQTYQLQLCCGYQDYPPPFSPGPCVTHSKGKSRVWLSDEDQRTDRRGWQIVISNLNGLIRVMHWAPSFPFHVSRRDKWIISLSSRVCGVLRAIPSTRKDVGTAPLSNLGRSSHWIVLAWYRTVCRVPRGQMTMLPVACDK